MQRYCVQLLKLDIVLNQTQSDKKVFYVLYFSSLPLPLLILTVNSTTSLYKTDTLDHQSYLLTSVEFTWLYRLLHIIDYTVSMWLNVLQQRISVQNRYVTYINIALINAGAELSTLQAYVPSQAVASAEQLLHSFNQFRWGAVPTPMSIAQYKSTTNIMPVN